MDRPPHIPHLDITNAVWDHLDKEQERKPVSKKSFKTFLKKPEELFLMTTYRHHKKAEWTEFRLGLKNARLNTDFKAR